MATNIGPKIGIEGEKEYKQEISSIIAQQKSLASEIKSVESAMDSETSAQEKAQKKTELLNKEIENQEKYISELTKKYDEMEQSGTATNKQLADQKTKINNATTALNKMKKELGDIPSKTKNVGKAMQDAGKKMQSVGKSLTTYVSAPIAALAASSVAAWNEVDKGMDIVAKKTGATGAELQSLQQSAKDIATSLPTSFEDAGTAIGEVNTKFGVTGTQLEDLTAKFIKFAQINDTDVNASVDNVQKAMAAFGLETKDAGNLMDVMTGVSQKTGISVDTLSASMVKNAASLREMGMDAYSAAGYLGGLEMSGLNTETAMKGMQTALKNAAEDGKTLPEALADFDAVMASSASDQEKLNAAIDLFGTKAGPTIYEACKDGSLHLSDFADDAEEYMGRVEQTFEDIKSPTDDFETAMNKVKEAGSQIGGTLLKIATPAIEGIAETADAASGWLDSLTESQQDMVAYAATFAMGVGPVTSTLGKILNFAGGIIENLDKVPAGLAAFAEKAGPIAVAALAFYGVKKGIEAAHDEAVDSVTGLRQMLDDNKTAVDALEDAASGVKDTVNETKTNINEINNKASTAESLVQELYALESVTSRTTAQQGRMRTIVGILNEMYPGLALAINDTTGELTEGKKEVKAYIENAKNLALLEAYTTGAKKAYEKLAEAQEQLNLAENQQKAGLDTLTTAYHNYYEQQSSALKDVQTQQTVYNASLQQAEDAYNTASASQAELNQSVRDAKAAIAEAEESVSFYEEEAQRLTGTLEETETAEEGAAEGADDYKAAVDGLADETEEELSEAEQAWADLYESTYESITSQVGLFDELKTETETTASEMAKNLQTQAEAFGSYAENLETAWAMANESTDPNFKAIVQNIADMGIDGAGYLQTFLTEAESGSETFDQILANYGNAEANKERLATTLTNIGTEAGDALDDAAQIVANKSGEMQTAGEKAAEGLETGVDTSKTKVKTAAEGVKDEVVTAMTTTLLSSGQSVMQAGGKIDNWLASGISMNKGKVKSAAEGAANEANNVGTYLHEADIKAAGETVGSALAEGLKNKKGDVKKAAEALGSAANDGAAKVRASRQQYVSAGQYAAEGLALGLESRRSRVLATAESIANAAARKIREALKVKSPSKVTMEIGGYVGEGLALGMLSEQDTVEAAAGKLSRAAYIPFGALKSDRYISGSGAGVYGSKGTLDPDAIYAAVRSGMQDASLGIYLDGREFGRTLKDMGVSVA